MSKDFTILQADTLEDPIVDYGLFVTDENEDNFIVSSVNKGVEITEGTEKRGILIENEGLNYLALSYKPSTQHVLIKENGKYKLSFLGGSLEEDIYMELNGSRLYSSTFLAAKNDILYIEPSSNIKFFQLERVSLLQGVLLKTQSNTHTIIEYYEDLPSFVDEKGLIVNDKVLSEAEDYEDGEKGIYINSDD